MSSTPPSTPPSPTNPPPSTSTLSDIFSTSPPLSPSASAPPSPSDIPRLRSTHTTAGYRTGISLSKPPSLQPGFDSFYPLGAIFGLRIGTLLGILEGLYASASVSKTDEKERVGKLVQQAREELSVERVFGREFWGEEGWRYEVVPPGGEREVEWGEVVGQHPKVREWERRVRGEVVRGGVGRGGFEGREWEGGRVGW